MFDPNKVAQELRSHLEAAVGDIASDMLSESSGFLDDKWDRKIKRAKKKGVQDVLGWLADELFNDPDTISDTIGDKLFEECEGDKVKMTLVLDVLEQNAHAGMKKAVKMQREFTT